MNPHWRINDVAYAHSSSLVQAEEQGYYIKERDEGANVTLTVMMNATIEKNNTKIICSSLYVHSPLTLLVIITGMCIVIAALIYLCNFIIDCIEPVLLQNPMISNPTASSVLIQWSPPYLWPGQVIGYYTVSVVGRDGEKTVHRVNTTYTDAVVPFTIAADHPEEVRNCSELAFTLSAVKTYDDGHCSELASFNIEGGYIPSELLTAS